MNLLWVLIVVLLVLALAGLPTWHGPGYTWGYWPSGLLGFVIIVVIILLLLGR